MAVIESRPRASGAQGACSVGVLPASTVIPASPSRVRVEPAAHGRARRSIAIVALDQAVDAPDHAGADQ